MSKVPSVKNWKNPADDSEAEKKLRFVVLILVLY